MEYFYAYQILYMLNFFKYELIWVRNTIRSLDKKILIIFLSVAILQTISWYYTSRRFFRQNLLPHFQSMPSVDLLNFLYWFIGDFITYFILPILIIRFLLRENTKDYGLCAGDHRKGLQFTIPAVLLMLIILWFVSSGISFSYTYPQLASARDNWGIFLIFETGMMIYMFAWEFIWRGFFLFGLERKFGYYSIMIQTIPFVILHNGKPELEAFSSIAGGIILGVIALRTRSFLYGFFIHYFIILNIDLLSTLRYRSGQFGVGFNSLIHLVRNIIGA